MPLPAEPRTAQGAQTGNRSLGREALACLLFLAAAVALTWPMAAHFTTRLGGDAGDPFQTLWSWRWMRDALFSLQNPFFSDRVFHPVGAPLVFQTFDLPIAVLTTPLWSVLPPFGVYNAGVLLAFWLTAFGMFRLARELTSDWLASVCAGVLFAAVPYHLAHAQGHQHLTDMGWLPLYFVYLERILAGRARPRDAALGGLFLALASLASWYHLLDALVATPVLFADAAIRRRAAIGSCPRRGPLEERPSADPFGSCPRTRGPLEERPSADPFGSCPFARRSLLLAASFLAVAGPLLAAILRARGAESVAGAHDAVRFSGDLEAFFFPNLAQGASHLWGGRAFRWSGNAEETALYAGYTALAAALVGAALAPAARAWLATALLGALLALGPYLHVGGEVRRSFSLPYAWLEKALPPLAFMGVPVRLGYLLYLGLLAAGALGIAALRRRAVRPGVRAAVALVPAGLLLAEYFPRPFIVTQAAVPSPMLAWARDPTPFAVLDLSGDYAMMFHAAVHRKPMTGGNLTRVPERLERWYADLAVVRSLRGQGFSMREVLARTDRAIDFQWGRGSPDPRLPADHFRIEWTGTLSVPAPGRWTFLVASDDAALLEIDGRRAVDNGGVHPWQTRSAVLELNAGPHGVRLVYEEDELDAGVRLEWEGPGVSREVVAGAALGEGLSARLFRRDSDCLLDRAAARAQLRALNVRYLVTGPGGSPCAQEAWGLRQTYQGEGVRIFEVEGP
jgi:hypothetical protein